MVSRRLRHRARGFTLLEAIIVITITGIVSVMVAVFIKTAIDSYFDSVRRAELTDMADVTLRRIEREIRLAVPNSLRLIPDSGGLTYLEFVPTSDGGRYRNEGDGSTCGDGTAPYCLCSGGTTNATFDVLGTASGSLPPKDAFIVVFNDASLGTTGSYTNIYRGGSRATVASVSAATASAAATITTSAFGNSTLICAYGNNRFQVVDSSGPVTYACQNASSGDMLRYSGYGFNTAQVAPGGTSALVVQNATCSIDYTPNAMQRIGLLYITLTLTKDGESITAFREIHVDNTP